jgi:hypothetical protein
MGGKSSGASEFRRAAFFRSGGFSVRIRNIVYPKLAGKVGDEAVNRCQNPFSGGLFHSYHTL